MTLESPTPAAPAHDLGPKARAAAGAQDFDAFLCHSSEDARAVERIHRVLESFRGPRGIQPRRLRIFHFRHDQRAGADLREQLRGFLARSGKLIVIASPSAARNDNVRFELQEFLAAHSQEDVCIALVKGTPAESFPEDVLRIGSEPVYADLRGVDTGWWRWLYRRRHLHRAFLAIIAQILQLDLDSLVRRDRARSRRQRASSIGAVALALLASLLAWRAWTASDVYQVRAAIADVPWSEMVRNPEDVATAARWLRALVATGHHEESRKLLAEVPRARAPGRTAVRLRVIAAQALQQSGAEPRQTGVERVLASLGEASQSLTAELDGLLDESSTELSLAQWSQAARRIADPAVRSYVLARVAARIAGRDPRAQLGDLTAQAFSAADEISDPEQRLRSLVYAVRASFQTGQVEQGLDRLRNAERVEASLARPSGEVLSDLALAWAEAGDADQAVAWVARARFTGNEPNEEAAYEILTGVGVALAEKSLLVALQQPLSRVVAPRYQSRGPLSELEIRIRVAQGACEIRDQTCAASLEFLGKGPSVNQGMWSKLLPRELGLKPIATNFDADNPAHVLTAIARSLVERGRNEAAARVLRVGNVKKALEETNGPGHLYNLRLLDYAYRTSYLSARVGEFDQARAATVVARGQEHGLREALEPEVFASLQNGWGVSPRKGSSGPISAPDLYSGHAWLLRGLAEGAHFAVLDAEREAAGRLAAGSLSLKQHLDVLAAEATAASLAGNEARAGRATGDLLDLLDRRRGEVPDEAARVVAGLLLSTVEALARGSNFQQARAASDEYLRWQQADCASDLAIANAAKRPEVLRPLLMPGRPRPLDADCQSHIASTFRALGGDASQLPGGRHHHGSRPGLCRGRPRLCPRPGEATGARPPDGGRGARRSKGRRLHRHPARGQTCFGRRCRPEAARMGPAAVATCVQALTRAGRCTCGGAA